MNERRYARSYNHTNDFLAALPELRLNSESRGTRVELRNSYFSYLRIEKHVSLADVSFVDCHFRTASFRGCNMRNAKFIESELAFVRFIGCDLTDASFYCSDLTHVELSECELGGARFDKAKINGIVLNGSTGLLKSSEWMAQHFESDELGYLVYKRFGIGTPFNPPVGWFIVPGAFIEDNVSPSPVDLCASGVNFATLDWVRQNKHEPSTPWLCRIRWKDLPDVVVPWGTDGKARCGRLELLRSLHSDVFTALCVGNITARELIA